jgi:hypothetical protein
MKITSRHRLELWSHNPLTEMERLALKMLAAFLLVYIGLHLVDIYNSFQSSYPVSIFSRDIDSQAFILLVCLIIATVSVLPFSIAEHFLPSPHVRIPILLGLIGLLYFGLAFPLWKSLEGDDCDLGACIGVVVVLWVLISAPLLGLITHGLPTTRKSFVWTCLVGLSLLFIVVIIPHFTYDPAIDQRLPLDGRPHFPVNIHLRSQLQSSSTATSVPL